MKKINFFPTLRLPTLVIFLLLFGNHSPLLAQMNPCLQFPQAGLDESQSLGIIEIEVLVFDSIYIRDFVYLTGPTVIRRGEPLEDAHGIPYINTQITQLDLKGFSNKFDSVSVQLNPNPKFESTGRIIGQAPGVDFPAKSHFNVYAEITLENMGWTFYNVAPLHIDATINCIPPSGTAYKHLLGGGVGLVGPPGVPAIATIIQATHKLESPLFSVVPDGNLDLKALGPFEFAGRSFFGGGIVEPMPPGDGWPPTGRIEPLLLGLDTSGPDTDNLDGLSFGMDEIFLSPAILKVYSFSVDNGSLGLPLTAVDFEVMTGTSYGTPNLAAPPEQIADIFISPLFNLNFLLFDEKDPTCFNWNMTVTNTDSTGSNCQKPGNPVGWPGGNSPENTDALEIDNIFKVGLDLDGDNKIDELHNPVYFSIETGSASDGMMVMDFRPGPPDGIASADDILITPPPGGSFGVYGSGTLDMGLQQGDELDAFCLLDEGTIGMLDPNTDKAIFSLAPGSPSLAGGASAADLFYTDFDGTFMPFVMANELGLLATDNLDALDCQAPGDLRIATKEPVQGDGPQGSLLQPGVPNPFTTSTIITLELPQTSAVQLKIYNLVGAEVSTLANEKLYPGTYQFEWDATGMKSGIYFCTLIAGTHAESIKLILIK